MRISLRMISLQVRWTGKARIFGRLAPGPAHSEWARALLSGHAYLSVGYYCGFPALFDLLGHGYHSILGQFQQIVRRTHQVPLRVALLLTSHRKPSIDQELGTGQRLSLERKCRRVRHGTTSPYRPECRHWPRRDEAAVHLTTG